MMNKVACSILISWALSLQASAGGVLFDFNHEPIHTPLPLT